MPEAACNEWWERGHWENTQDSCYTLTRRSEHNHAHQLLMYFVLFDLLGTRTTWYIWKFWYLQYRGYLPGDVGSLEASDQRHSGSIQPGQSRESGTVLCYNTRHTGCIHTWITSRLTCPELASISMYILNLVKRFHCQVLVELRFIREKLDREDYDGVAQHINKQKEPSPSADAMVPQLFVQAHLLIQYVYRRIDGYKVSPRNLLFNRISITITIVF